MALPILDGNQTATTLSTILTGGAHIPAHTVVSLGSQAITDVRSAVSGSVISISNFPSTQTIAGTVTANVLNLPIANNGDEFPMDGPRLAVQLVDISSQAISILPVSGTVTVGNSVTISSIPAVMLLGSNGDPIDNGGQIPIFGNVNVDLLPAISGTVTANNPSGALTTRFGSVATANLAFITSAVTKTNRKYLLAQNISAGTVTIGIGFSPTTTQGIQLTAGAGLTFDAFCPTGAVYWLGAVTGAAFTILEG